MVLPADSDDTGGGTVKDSTGAVVSVSELAAAPDGGSVWLKGYIVGYVPSGGKVGSSTVFGSDNAPQTNIVLADSPDETDGSRCVAVQLLIDTDPRTDLNLSENTENLWRLVWIYGTKVSSYYGSPGLKPAMDYSWTAPADEEEEVPASVFPTVSDAPAEVLEGA